MGITKTVVVIQARMSSSRFPGKVMKPLAGMPMIAFMLKRVLRARRIDEVIVAISTDRSDDPLAECLASLGQRFHRGSLDDVLDRFYEAASSVGADTVVRLTGDCPLVDPGLIDQVIELLASDPSLHYVSNIDPPTFPDGLDIEAFRFSALKRAHRQATQSSDREHVTPYLRKHKALFPASTLKALADLSHLRWTVDYEDDLQFVSALLDASGHSSPLDADRFDFYRAIEAHPALLAINQHGRNEGYALSLKAESAHTPS